MTPEPGTSPSADRPPFGPEAEVALIELLTGWLPDQRWFTAKGSVPRLSVVGSLELPVASDGDAPSGVRAVDLLVRDDGGREPVLYQVPLTLRREPAPELAQALVGEVDSDTLVYDGCHDPAGALALLAAVTGERELAGGDVAVTGHLVRGAGATPAPASVTSAKPLGGEQSNTSIVYRTAEGPDLIGKVFRVLHAGTNPDVEIQEALAADGCTRVPAPLGDLGGTWPAAADDDAEIAENRGAGASPATGHLFFAQAFLPGTTDAWRVATAAAEAGESFAERARALGAATAEVHAPLARDLPAVEADDTRRGALLRSWEQRLDAAMTAVPELAADVDDFRKVLTAAGQLAWPRLQRVHGDYHLGQVLDVPGSGWVLLDFEGEPLRPLAERTEPDLTLRDVAGMLRSFDYAAGSAARSGAGADAAHRAEAVLAWAAEAREAFLDGYAAEAAAAGAEDPRDHTALLRALELDKALYEVVYEARNRPDWIDIPLGGLDRILGRA